MYTARGFDIRVYHVKINLTLIIYDNTSGPQVQKICAGGIHIPIIELSIKTINQGAHCTTNSMPYKRYINIMKISLVTYIVHSRNYFHKNVPSEIL